MYFETLDTPRFILKVMTRERDKVELITALYYVAHGVGQMGFWSPNLTLFLLKTNLYHHRQQHYSPFNTSITIAHM